MDCFDFCKPRFYRTLRSGLQTDTTMRKEFLGTLCITSSLFVICFLFLMVVLFGNMIDTYYNFMFASGFFGICGCFSFRYTYGVIKPLVQKVRQEMKYIRLSCSPEHQRGRMRRRSGRQGVHYRAGSPSGSDTVAIDLHFFEEEGPPAYEETIVEVPTTMASSSGACGYGSE